MVEEFEGYREGDITYCVDPASDEFFPVRVVTIGRNFVDVESLRPELTMRIAPGFDAEAENRRFVRPKSRPPLVSGDAMSERSTPSVLRFKSFDCCHTTTARTPVGRSESGTRKIQGSGLCRLESYTDAGSGRPTGQSSDNHRSHSGPGGHCGPRESIVRPVPARPLNVRPLCDSRDAHGPATQGQS